MIDVVRPTMLSVLLLAAAWAAPVEARVVKFQTSSPLADRSDRSLERAIESAVDTCVRSATAMGLASIRLDDAVVQNNRLVVQMVATDDDADDEEVEVHDLTPRAMTEHPRL